MAGRVFIQKSRIGLVIFELKDDVLVVSESKLGNRQRSEFLLRNINVEYERVARRFWMLIAAPFALCVLGLWITCEILTRERMPVALVGYPIMFTIGFLAMTIRGIPRVDAFQFFNDWKKPVFYIVREKKQAAECDDFVRELLYRIECAQNGQKPADEEPEDEVRPLLLPGSGSVALLISGEYRWKASIALGAFSAGIPWVGKFLGLFDVAPFPLVFFGSVGGLSFCVLSYQGKERLRHLSLVGAVLAMIAPLYY